MGKGTELRAVITASDKMSPVLRGIAKNAVAAKMAVGANLGAMGKQLAPLANRVRDVGSAFGGVAQKIGLFGVLAGGAALAGLASVARGAVDAAGGLQDAADRTGVAVEALQQWRAVAGLAGVSADDVDNSMIKLNKTLFNAANGEKKSAALFASMHIGLRNADGSIRKIEDVLPELAQAFDKTDDPATRTAMAMTLFGKSGAKLIPILAQGKGLSEALAEAQRKGIVVSQEAVSAMDDLGDAQDTVLAQMRGIAGNIVGSLAPGMTEMVSGLSEWIAANKDLIQANVSESMRKLAQTVKNIDWKAVAEGAQAFFDAAVWFVSSGTLNRLVIGFAAIKALQIAAEFATIGKALWGLGAAVGALGAKGLAWGKFKKTFTGPMPKKSGLNKWAEAVRGVFQPRPEIVGPVPKKSGLSALGASVAKVVKGNKGLAKTVGWVKKLGVVGKVIRPLGLALGAMALAQTAFAKNPNETDDQRAERGKMLASLAGSFAGGAMGMQVGAMIGTAIMPGIGSAVGGAIGGILGSILGEEGAVAVAGWLQGMGSQISTFFTATLPYYAGYGVGLLVDAVGNGFELAKATGIAAWNGLTQFLTDFWNDPLGAIQSFITSAGQYLSGFIDSVKNWFSGLGDTIRAIFDNARKGFNDARGQGSSASANADYQSPVVSPVRKVALNSNSNIHISGLPSYARAETRTTGDIRVGNNVGYWTA